MSNYKVIDGFSSAEETVDKINDLVELGYDEKEVTIMTKKENEERLENITTAKIDTVAADENKGMMDKIKETFSDSDEDNPLGKYDLEDHIREQYNPLVKDGGFVILVEENTSFTMGKGSDNDQANKNTTMTGGKTGDYNETPGGINPIIPGTGIDGNDMNRKPDDVRTSDNGGTDVQDDLPRPTMEEEIQSSEVTKTNQELNNQSLTGKPVEPNVPGFGIDPNIPPQNTETQASDDDLIHPQDLDKTTEKRRELQNKADERKHL